MTPNDTLRKQLRQFLSEKIPQGGSDADTRFSDEEVDQLLLDAQTVFGAAATGWMLKAGMLQEEAELEEERTGAESYRYTKLQDRLKFAQTMAEHYGKLEANKTGDKTGLALRITPPGVI